jgi:hypothetical protein
MSATARSICSRRSILPRGTVISDIRASHNQDDFIAFLNKINREVPAELDVNVILDNLATHKTPKVQR